MKNDLLDANQDWQVWTIWYDNRLDGHVLDEDNELAYVLIDEALWEQGPAAVNAEIKKRIEALEPLHDMVQLGVSSRAVARGFAGVSVAERTPLPKPSRKKKQTSPRPDIPLQRPAALEPVWSNGKLVLPSKPARTDGDSKAVSAAIKVLRAEIIELADDAESEPGNFDKRIVPYLRRIGGRIPDHRAWHRRNLCWN